MYLYRNFNKFRYNTGRVGRIGYPPVVEKQRARTGERQKPKVSGENSSRALASDYVRIRIFEKDSLFVDL